VDRAEAERIVRRDLPGVIKEMLKGLPMGASRGLVEQIYRTTFEAMVQNLVDGTLPLGPDRRLTSQLAASTGTLSFGLKDSSGNVTRLPNT
jgi:hypothetical protein